MARYRKLMGSTNQAEAHEGTIRKAYGTDIGENGCHGSDSAENAAREIAYFFAETELCPR